MMNEHNKKLYDSFQKEIKDNPLNFISWNKLGHFLKNIGDLKGAQLAFEKVLSLAKQQSNNEYIGVAYGNIGSVRYLNDQLDNITENFLFKSLKISENLDCKESISADYNNLSIFYIKKGLLEEAEKFIIKSLELNIQLNIHEYIADDYAGLGFIYQMKGKLHEAKEMYTKGLNILKQHEGKKEYIDKLQYWLDKLNEELNN